VFTPPFFKAHVFSFFVTNNGTDYIIYELKDYVMDIMNSGKFDDANFSSNQMGGLV